MSAFVEVHGSSLQSLVTTPSVSSLGGCVSYSKSECMTCYWCRSRLLLTCFCVRSRPTKCFSCAAVVEVCARRLWFKHNACHPALLLSCGEQKEDDKEYSLKKT